MRVGHGRVVPAGGAWLRWRVDLPEVVGRNDGRGGGSEADHGAECAGGKAFAAVEGDGARIVALGEAFAVDGLLADGVTPEVQRALDGLLGQIEPLRAELELARGRVTRLQEEANMHPFLPLPNRREFLRELGLVISHQQPGSVPPALAIVHFSGAEAIRIQAGRAALDGALQHAYSLITVVLGGTDVIGSLGGNDFGIILLAGDPESVTCKRADLTAAIHDQPFVWQGVKYRFNPQIGFAAITGDVMPERVLETADRDLLSK